MAASMKLGEIVNGALGKRTLREDLCYLVEMGQWAPPEELQYLAAGALKTIEYLNQELADLHDLILPPKEKQ